MARLPMKKGFVLSFSTFTLALFLVIFAQAHYTQLQSMQFDAVDARQVFSAARVLHDISRDFNSLTGQSIRIDQNESHAQLFISGIFPAPLELQNNIWRYQSASAKLAHDNNAALILDWNQVITTRALVGRTTNGLAWNTSLDNNSLDFYPTDYLSNAFTRMDVNIIADAPHGDQMFDVIVASGDLYPDSNYTVIVRYVDTNSAHTTTSTYVMDARDYLSISYAYRDDEGDIFSYKTLGIGASGGTTYNPYYVSMVGDSNVVWRYSVSILAPHDSNGVRAGYDANVTLRGRDLNVDTNTIWTAGG